MSEQEQYVQAARNEKLDKTENTLDEISLHIFKISSLE